MYEVRVAACIVKAQIRQYLVIQLNQSKIFTNGYLRADSSSWEGSIIKTQVIFKNFPLRRLLYLDMV